ncbi:MAG: hypothetical protein WBF58_07605, partial [Xanthobacteraceae bacterium]
MPAARRSPRLDLVFDHQRKGIKNPYFWSFRRLHRELQPLDLRHLEFCSGSFSHPFGELRFNIAFG